MFIEELLDYLLVLAKLVEELPDEFDAYQIDRRLLQQKTGITLIGVLHIDPNSRWASIAEKVLQHAKQLLIKNAQWSELKSETIAQRTKLSDEEVKL